MAPNILVVDDDPLIHELYRSHLERAGYRMLSATTGEEAIEMSPRETPHLVVMDIGLPGLDGLAALRQLRKQEHTKSIPVIVITAEAKCQIYEKQVKEIGRAIFMPKPFGPVQLLTQIKRMLDGGAS